MTLKPNYLEPIKNLIDILKSKNISLSNRRALEFFARRGDWHTLGYSSLVKSLDAWEIDSIYANDLRKNLPNANICIGNSFDLALKNKFSNKFDFIMFDNPMALYGQDKQYCEHFEALKLIKILSSSDSVTIFNVNFNPFGLDQNKMWENRRNIFYGKDSKKITIEFLLNFYKGLFQSYGFHVTDYFYVKRTDAWGEGERIAYFAYRITR